MAAILYFRRKTREREKGTYTLLSVLLSYLGLYVCFSRPVPHKISQFIVPQIILVILIENLLEDSSDSEAIC